MQMYRVVPITKRENRWSKDVQVLYDAVYIYSLVYLHIVKLLDSYVCFISNRTV